MTDTRASLIVIAPTVEEAVEKGLKDLGLAEDAVEVEILDSGSRGLFGIGSRHARVRLTIKASVREETGADVVEEPARAKEPQAVQPARERESLTTVEEEEDLPETIEPETVFEEEFEEEEDYGYEERAGTEEENFALNVARETVVDLLERMKIQAEVISYYGEPDDARSRTPLRVDISGKDLSILIGPRAETLNALQYIASLIIGKELGRSVPLVVDVEGYRVRREQQIRRVARRMAEQAVKTGRRQILEPMPANERRLVHIELRQDPRVTTESVGEDPRRKVTIIPVQ